MFRLGQETHQVLFEFQQTRWASRSKSRSRSQDVSSLAFYRRKMTQPQSSRVICNAASYQPRNLNSSLVRVTVLILILVILVFLFLIFNFSFVKFLRQLMDVSAIEMNYYYYYYYFLEQHRTKQTLAVYYSLLYTSIPSKQTLENYLF